MSRPRRKLHLFNCDRTYKLDAVEDLLTATKAKLGFDSVDKHYFSLAQMSEMITNTIPKLEMDVAFFVVHAHESRLSINEDNAGIGYAKIYRALLEVTEGKVIIIIGGDDSYKSEDEEDRVVISRWARRKIISQFSDEFLDGSKSFIFSWNKKHREIHVEALLHYFDPDKKGQKFEYQPKPKEPERGKSGQTSSGSFLEQKYQSVDEQRREGIGGSNSSSALQRRQTIASGSSYKSAQTNPLQNYQSTNEQRGKGFRRRSSSSSEQRREDFSVGRSRSAEEPGEYNSPSRHNIAEQSRDDYSFGSITGTAMATSDSEHGAKSIKPPSASSGRTKFTEVAILFCNVSEDSIDAVMKVFHKIAPKLNLSANPTQENLPPGKIKAYLMDVHLKACILVVDGKTVKDAYENLTERKEEYQRLLETAAIKVEKVIILICDDCSLPPKDEEIVSRTIEEIVIQRGKGYIAWLKNGRLSVDPDVLVQCLMSTSPTPQPNPQTNPLRASQEKNRVVPGSTAESFPTYPGQSQIYPPQRNPPNMQPPTQQAAATCHSPARNVTGEPVLLRSILRRGRISYQLEDLQLWDPTFTTPEHLNQILFQQYYNTPEIGVTIEQGIDGKLQCSVDPKLIEVSKSRYEGIQIASNETLMLKTRILYGQVSFQESDVHFRHGIWQIPDYIMKSLKEEYRWTPTGDLFIISDDRGNLRRVVKVGVYNRVRSAVNKRGL